MEGGLPAPQAYQARSGLGGERDQCPSSSSLPSWRRVRSASTAGYFHRCSRCPRPTAPIYSATRETAWKRVEPEGKPGQRGWNVSPGICSGSIQLITTEMSAVRPMPSPHALSDEELMRRLAAGRQESLGRLHRRYAPLVFKKAAHSLDRSTAEEIVQDVFVAVWRNAGVFSPERGAFRPWVLRIAHFRILNELRRRRRLPRLEPDPDGSLLASLPDDGPEPEELAWRESLRPAMRSACRELPRSQRQAVDLAFFKD